MWSDDFIQGGTADGGTARILSITDKTTREGLFFRRSRSFPARRAIDALEDVVDCTGRKPGYVRSDNGPEFLAKSVQDRLGQAQIGPRHIEPGAPWENGCVESFYAQPRAELLDRESFDNLVEVEAALEDWCYRYNYRRPHGSLGKLPPAIAAKRELPLQPTACAPVAAGKRFANNQTKKTPIGLPLKAVQFPGVGSGSCNRIVTFPRLCLPRPRVNLPPFPSMRSRPASQEH